MTERREQITLPEAVLRKDAAVAYNNKLSDRWSLSLAVANGGGMLAVTTQLLSKDVTAAIASSLLPAAWAFSAGLILVGIGQGLAHLSAAVSALGYERMIKQARQTGEAGVGNTSWFYDTVFWTEVGCETLAATAFVAGVVYPLATYPFPAT